MSCFSVIMLSYENLVPVLANLSNTDPRVVEVAEAEERYELELLLDVNEEALFAVETVV